MNFPRRFLPVLRCIKDGGELSVFAEVRADKAALRKELCAAANARENIPSKMEFCG